jgi:DNA-binding transcriptional regulator LsrR (DeoR family)
MAPRDPRAGESLQVATRFAPELLYRAAQLYYLEDANQADIAQQLNTSRTTVSRLLAEARAAGIVRIEVVDPASLRSGQLAADLRRALGLRAPYVTPSDTGRQVGPVLARAVSEALAATDLKAGEALLVSSGATLYAVAQQPLPSLPGVLVAPTVGGVDEPGEPYQTNEIARAIAVKVHGSPVLLYAPLAPSEGLYRMLLEESSTRRVTSLWTDASVALLGIGAPPRTRELRPSVLARDDALLTAAVGDICARPFDGDGHPLPFPGSDRLMAMGLEDLTRVPWSIGVAVGLDKVPAILAAVKAGWVNTIVTDAPTARALLAQGVVGAGRTPPV